MSQLQTGQRCEYDQVLISWQMLTYGIRWRDAVRTLAKFHRVDYTKVGLERFGRHHGFYDRQIKTLGTISKAQAAAIDVESQEPVGDIPHFDEMIEFFKNKSQQPPDRSTLVHGDYKIDNLVFHKTEPRVIGILDWEMATIGHPLSDFVNLVGPYTWSSKQNRLEIKSKTSGTKSEFENGIPGLPSLDQVIRWYVEESGYDIQKDLAWGVAFGGFRGGVIMQGIAARYARRQASSATAMEYGSQMRPYGEWAWRGVELLQHHRSRAKL